MNPISPNIPIKGETKESLRRFSGANIKFSMAQSNDSASYRHHGSRQSFQTDSPQKSQKTKKSIRLSDLMAAMYPGIKIGHKYCVQRSMLVPKTMGWLWNTEDTATGVPFPRGWRPGAIALGVKRRFSRPRSITEPLSTPVGSKGKKIKKKFKTTSSTLLQSGSEISEVSIEQRLPPTLCIKKEHGIYSVTMQPINPGIKENEQTEEKPVHFKIAEDSISSNSRTSNKSSSSSLKIEYMCTGALRKPMIKPELAEVGTQWDVSDFIKKEKEKEKKEETKQDTASKKKKDKK